MRLSPTANQDSRKSSPVVNGNHLFVDNTGEAFHEFVYPYVRDAVKNGTPLPEELADSFTLTILKGFNDDGSDRGILNWA
jgi:hypothetical protein